LYVGEYNLSLREYKSPFSDSHVNAFLTPDDPLFNTECDDETNSGHAHTEESGRGHRVPARASPLMAIPFSTAASHSAPRTPAPLLARTAAPSSPSPFVPKADDSAAEILRCAETLGVPWKRLLLAEIDAEQRLRRYLTDIAQDCPLPAALKILSFSFLDSWRARDQIHSLACEARGASVPEAVKQLRIVFLAAAGKNDHDRIAFAEHLRFAYHRVLLLQRVRRAAAKSRGTTAERLAFICSRARCSYDDAAWAVVEEDSPNRGDRFDSAVRKVREEGFLIPKAETEARSLADLRRIVAASPHLTRRRASLERPRLPVSAPRRVPLPVSAV
jgi:hypothetical protein